MTSPILLFLVPKYIPFNSGSSFPGSGVAYLHDGKKELKLVGMSAATMAMTSISTTPVIYDISSGVAAGTDYTQRVGRRIRVRHVVFKGQVEGGQGNTAADDPYNTVRVLVIRGRSTFTASGLTINSIIDPRTMPGLVEVLYDDTVLLTTTGKNSTGFVTCACEYELGLKNNIALEYTGTTASAPGNESIFFVTVSDSNVVANPGFSASSFIRMEFLDD